METDELVDAAPVVESPCHREQLASVSRGLPRCGYALGREGSPPVVPTPSGGGTTTSRGCVSKTRRVTASAVRLRGVLLHTKILRAPFEKSHFQLCIAR